MHVWIVCGAPKHVPGGARRHMELHADGLVRLGHRADVFFAEDFISDRSGPTRLPGIQSILSLLERCRKDRPDIVNVHTGIAPSWILARRLGLISTKIVVMSYAADEKAITIKGAKDMLRWLRTALPARSTFREADGLWCVNQQDLEFYVANYDVAREKLVRLPHAAHDSFYESCRDEPRSLRQLLFVGMWIHRKGSDVLRVALDRVIAEAKDVTVVIAGTLSSEDSIRAQLSARLSQRTRIIERADDLQLAQLYRESALLLTPSRREGLPITLLEAMACGCPALVAANSGMLDVIEPGENGWLEVSFDPEQWAQRILQLLSQPEKLMKASEGAQRTAEAFRVTRVAESVVRWYEKILAR